MIKDDDLEEIRNALINSARPLIFFDDDPDGLSSFLQFYKLNTESKGIIYKSSGALDTQFLKKVSEYQPDNIFILDVAEVSQDFLDKVHNVYWIDHHSPLERKNVHYFNPMILSKGKDNRPISYWAWKITQKSNWLALVGCVGDWFIPEDIRNEFKKESENNFNYTDLFPDEITKPEDALFKTKIGKLARIFSFVLKGTTKEAMSCVKTLTRINDPYEILDQKTSQGKYIYKKYEKINKIYQEIKNSIKPIDNNLLLYIYSDEKMALTSDLSNEILYENPDKFIIIGRERNGDIKCSLRSAKYEVLPILEKSLKGINGFGGGHLHACGANIKKNDFEKFIENIKYYLSKLY
ncbi:MAG: DHH family phosphoesterase [Candidatus Woesearchaeota archaeon]